MMDLAVNSDGSSILAGSSDTTILQWQMKRPSLAELRAWVESNRYVAEAAAANGQTLSDSGGILQR